METFVTALNTIGKTFVDFSLSMLIQSGLLILILLALDLLLRKKVQSVFRYFLWLLVLAKLLLPTSFSAPTSLAYWLGDQLPAVAVQPASPPADVPPLPGPVINSSPIETIAANSAPAMAPAAPIHHDTLGEAVAMPQPPAATASLAPSLSWQAIVFVLWLAVFITMTLLMLQKLYFVRGLIAQAGPAGDELTGLLNECRVQMRMKHPVALKLSPNAASPAVCGLLRPVILLPQGLSAELDPRHLKAILLHELAHIKRADLWVSFLQTILQIAYFYHPLLWLANLIIRRLREQAVDEMVLVVMADQAEDYPNTLLKVSKLAFSRPALSLRLLGVVESKSSLRRRIQHMVSRPYPKSAKLGLAGLLAILLTAAILLPMAKGEKQEISNTGDLAGKASLWGIRPDASRQIYNLDGTVKMETLGFARGDQGIWDKKSQRCDFIVQLPPGSIRSNIKIRPAGTDKNLSWSIYSHEVMYGEKELHWLPATFALEYKKGIFKRDVPINKVDLTLTYFPADAEEHWGIEGPFISGQTVTAKSDKTYTIEFQPNAVHGQDVDTHFNLKVDGDFDESIPLVVYDLKNKKHLSKNYSGKNHIWNCTVERIALEHIQRIAFVQPSTVEVENINLRIENEHALPHAAHLGKIAERLGPTDLTPEELNDCNFKDVHEFIKVIDLLQGSQIGWGLIQKSYVHNAFDSLTSQEKEILRSTLKQWSLALDPDIRFLAIERGMAEKWPEFIPMALDEYEKSNVLPEWQQSERWRLIGGIGLGSCSDIMTEQQLRRIVHLADIETDSHMRQLFLQVLRRQTRLPLVQEKAQKEFEANMSPHKINELFQQLLEQPDEAWTRQLDNGVTVRLLSVVACPSRDNTWFRPDGAALAGALYPYDGPLNQFGQIYPSVETIYMLHYAVLPNPDYPRLTSSFSYKASAADTQEKLRSWLNLVTGHEKYEILCQWIVAPKSVGKIDVSLGFEQIDKKQAYDWAEFKNVLIPVPIRKETQPSEEPTQNSELKNTNSNYTATLLSMAKATYDSPEFILKGTVTDAQTGQPIAGAKVGDNQKYNGGKFCTITDPNGHYEYKTWYEEHDTTAEATGYQSQQKGFTTKLLGSEKEKVINYELVPKKSTEAKDNKFTTDPVIKVIPSNTEALSSRAWYLLRQRNIGPLLLGLTQRLGQVVEYAAPTGHVWTGQEGGGSLKLEITVENNLNGQIYVGFFTDPAWSAAPVQVRSFPGPGQYIVGNLPVGQYQIGAMIGSLPVATALGVHET